MDERKNKKQKTKKITSKTCFFFSLSFLSFRLPLLSLSLPPFLFLMLSLSPSLSLPLLVLLLVPHPALLESDRRPLLRKLLDLGGELGDRRGRARVDKLAELLELGAGLARRLDVGGDLDTAVDELGDLVEVGLDEPARRQGRGAHAESPRNEGRDVPGDRVLVGGDVRQLEHALDARAVDALGPQVGEHDVVVGSACF